MTLTDIQTLLDYNYWADHRILAAAKQLPAERFLTTSDERIAALRATLVHIMDGEHGWRMICQQIPDAHFDYYLPEMFPTVESLAQIWQDDEREMREYISRLADADTTSIVRYEGDYGAIRERPLWHCMYHLVNHGTQHRSEAAVILTELGCSPGDLDFTLFVNERSASE
jgi:uncharacterized damage-inducible protein DinB